jgi:thioredoxin 1
MASLTQTTDENYEAEVLKSELICCVYYNAAWCKAGLDLIDTVKAAADDVDGKMKFCEVDTDKTPKIIQAASVHTIPTIQFVKNGETVDQLRGAVSKLDLLGKISAVLTEHGGDQEDLASAEAASAEPDSAESADPPAEASSETPAE